MVASTRASSSAEPIPFHCPMATFFHFQGAARAMLRNPAALAGSVLLVAIAVLALLSGVLFPGDPMDMVARPLLPPLEDRTFFLGSDSLGRNVAAGLVHGAKVSLMVGVVAAILSLLIGVLVGAVGGYFGGLVDDLLVRLTELVQTVPAFLLVIVIVSVTKAYNTYVEELKTSQRR